MGEPTQKAIGSVFLFPNGMLAVCDMDGKQIPEFEGNDSLALRQKIGAQITRQEPNQPLYYGCTRSTFEVAR